MIRFCFCFFTPARFVKEAAGHNVILSFACIPSLTDVFGLTMKLSLSEEVFPGDVHGVARVIIRRMHVRRVAEQCNFF